MRPSILNFLFNDVSSLSGIGPKFAKLIKKLAGPHIGDVLWHLPSGVNYRGLVKSFDSFVPGQMGTFCMEVAEHVIPSSRRVPYRVLGMCGAQPIELVFFNYHKQYVAEALPIGSLRWISGKIELNYGKIQVMHPDYITADLDKIPEYETVYPLTAGLSGKIIAKAVHQALPRVPQLPEWLDGPFMKQEGFHSWRDSLVKAHSPKTREDLSPLHPARRRLAYDELLANQLALLLSRQKMKRKRGFKIDGDGHLTNTLLKQLPYELTGAQIRAIGEIKNDAMSEYKMLRLLQGDVGAGKTIVALFAMLNAVETRCQAVLMAPTDILARQHLATFKRFCDPLGVRVELLTGREKGKKRNDLLEDIKNGNINILIGTHAVFVEDVLYQKLGLVVIDEQHKFGVAQRLALTDKQKGVDLLVMTATPIPRTLALTSYGDMDMSVLDEKPVGRKPIDTRVLPVSKLDEVVQKIYDVTTYGSKKTQAYWVCPLVEESEKSDLMAVEKRYEELKNIFGNKVGLVHGKMKGMQKDAVMAEFAAGNLSVLVSTTVIEVGVDVKAATLMVIEHAERFGLAQLHQLRGRIGRGSEQSVCLLLYAGHLSDTGKARLKIMRETENGFLIAEEDLKLRGAGEVLGSKQSGFQEFHLADLSVHGDLLLTASQDAKMILNMDADLTTSRGQALKNLLYLFQKDQAILTLKSG